MNSSANLFLNYTPLSSVQHLPEQIRNSSPFLKQKNLELCTSWPDVNTDNIGFLVLYVSNCFLKQEASGLNSMKCWCQYCQEGFGRDCGSVLGGIMGSRQGFMLTCRKLWPGIQCVHAILYYISVFMQRFFFFSPISKELSKR